MKKLNESKVGSSKKAVLQGDSASRKPRSGASVVSRRPSAEQLRRVEHMRKLSALTRAIMDWDCVSLRVQAAIQLLVENGHSAWRHYREERDELRRARGFGPHTDPPLEEEFIAPGLGLMGQDVAKLAVANHAAAWKALCAVNHGFREPIPTYADGPKCERCGTPLARAVEKGLCAHCEEKAGADGTESPKS
jgi:hypothetical protein